MANFILYRSQSLLSRDMGTIIAIQREAERYNMEVGITGYLYCHERGFVQYLEGEPGPLCVCYARILASTRHWGAEVLQTGVTLGRRFSSWYVGLADADDRRYAALHGEKRLADLPPDAIIGAMCAFAQEKEAHASDSLLPLRETGRRCA